MHQQVVTPGIRDFISAAAKHPEENSVQLCIRT
jgi:hypothetical protein